MYEVKMAINIAAGAAEPLQLHSPCFCAPAHVICFSELCPGTSRNGWISLKILISPLDVFLSKELYGQIRKNMVNAAEVVQLLQLQYL